MKKEILRSLKISKMRLEDKLDFITSIAKSLELNDKEIKELERFYLAVRKVGKVNKDVAIGILAVYLKRKRMIHLLRKLLGKRKGLLRTIGELSKILKIEAKDLKRNLEDIFSLAILQSLHNTRMLLNY